MDNLIDKLIHFGLTRQEAGIYLELLQQGPLTGYEVSKSTGISRSNTYSSLSNLADKGAAVVLEEAVTRYCAVDFQEFSTSFIRNLSEMQSLLLPILPKKKEEAHGYITIRGAEQIMNKLISLISEAQMRIYLSVPPEILASVEKYLIEQLIQGKKIVLLTETPYTLEGATIYHIPSTNNQIRMIVDSQKVITGSIGIHEVPTCLFSQNKNLIDIFKSMLKNEITLIQLQQNNKP